MSCEEQLSAMESVNIDFASVQNFWFIPSQMLVSLLDCLVLPFKNVFLYFLKFESKKIANSMEYIKGTNQEYFGSCL